MDSFTELRNKKKRTETLQPQRFQRRDSGDEKERTNVSVRGRNKRYTCVVSCDGVTGSGTRSCKGLWVFKAL